MRSKKAMINMVIALAEELVSIICGFILPRLILEKFGSGPNGLATSITQFLRCAVLLRAGIGGATRAALYKPLAEGDKAQIDSIMRATEIFMHRIAMILGVLITLSACVYPLFVGDEFSWFFTASLVMIIGISAFAESYFGITYQILLQADQRTYVFSVVKSGAVIANTCIAALLMRLGASLHLVQLGNALAYAAIPVVINVYVRRRYRINRRVQPNTVAIAQRWDAFAQQAAAFVMNNTGVIILTMFAPITEVSVYAVYNMVIIALNRALLSVTSGIEAAFGNMLAKRETAALQRNFGVVEFLVFMLSNVLYTAAAALILGFVSVYTRGVTDAVYIRPAFAYVLLLGGFMNSVRIPYQLLVNAAGHYRQTRNGAVLEAVINIALSVALVIRFGLIGVAVGALCAIVFRTVQYGWYASRVILRRPLMRTVKNYLASALFALCALALLKWLVPESFGGYGAFVLYGVMSVAAAGVLTLALAAAFYRRELRDSISAVCRVFRRRLKA